MKPKNSYNPRPLSPEIETIYDVVYDYYRVTKSDLLAKKKMRFRNLVVPRQLVMCFAMEFCTVPEHRIAYNTYSTKPSQTDVGGLFSKDHSTVNHALKTIRELCETSAGFNEGFENMLSDIKNKLKNPFPV